MRPRHVDASGVGGSLPLFRHWAPIRLPRPPAGASIPDGFALTGGVWRGDEIFGLAGVPLETRKALLHHLDGDITIPFSPVELRELIGAIERLGEAQRMTVLRAVLWADLPTWVNL